LLQTLGASIVGDSMMIGLRPLLTLVVLSGSVEAQDWSAGVAIRALESPGHETLMALVERSDTSLASFETDGCSGGLSEAWHVIAGQFSNFANAHGTLPPWESCCVTHDRAYQNAGGMSDAISSFEARLTADLALKSCVISTGTDRVDVYDVSLDQIAWAYESIAEAMFIAVRIGGAPCSVLPWRWGYGYPSCSTLVAIFD
jgi:hypothetical protein